MYKYEVKYLEKLIEILSNTKAEYNDAVLESPNTIYMKFLSDLHSFFPNDTFAWSSLSEKKKNNALKVFEAEKLSSPLYIIDNTILHSAKGGALFTPDTIHFKNILEKPGHFHWNDIIKYKIVTLNDNACIFKFENGGYTLQVAKSLAQKFISFREKLRNDSELNKAYIDYINASIKQALDNVKECTEENLSLQLSDISIFLWQILKIMSSANDEKNKELINALYYCIGICDKLYALSMNQTSTLPASRLMTGPAHKDIENLYQEIQKQYSDEHYDNFVRKAEGALEEKNYADALEYIHKAQNFEHRVETDYLQITVLTDSANEDNQFNREAVLKVCESIDMDSIPDDISQRLTLNTQQYENLIADIKDNMPSYCKENPIEYFTNSVEMMRLSDKYDMTPAMYFVLYGYDFNISILSCDDKISLMNHKNVFHHSILDIASLASFSQYHNIKLMLDDEFSEKETTFNNKYKWAKRKDTFLGITDFLVDSTKNFGDMEYQSARRTGDVERAENALRLKEETHYFLEDVERDSAEQMLTEYQNEQHSEYIEMRDKIMEDIENFERQETIYPELLSLYKNLITKYN